MDRHVIADHMAGCIIACEYNGYGLPTQIVLPGKEVEGNNHLTLGGDSEPAKVTLPANICYKINPYTNIHQTMIW